MSYCFCSGSVPSDVAVTVRIFKARARNVNEVCWGKMRVLRRAITSRRHRYQQQAYTPCWLPRARRGKSRGEAGGRAGVTDGRGNSGLPLGSLSSLIEITAAGVTILPSLVSPRLRRLASSGMDFIAS